MLQAQEVALAIADTMLASACPVHRKRTRHDLVVECFSAGYFGTVIWINQYEGVEVAIADMANDRCDQAACLDVQSHALDAFCQPGDGYAYIGGDAAASGPQVNACEISVVTGLPQSAAFFRMGCPFKLLTTMFVGDRLN